MSNIDNSIEKIKSASPLELPYVIMETELHDKKTSYEIYEEVSKTFEGEGMWLLQFFRPWLIVYQP